MTSERGVDTLRRFLNLHEVEQPKPTALEEIAPDIARWALRLAEAADRKSIWDAISDVLVGLDAPLIPEENPHVNPVSNPRIPLSVLQDHRYSKRRAYLRQAKNGWYFCACDLLWCGGWERPIQVVAGPCPGRDPTGSDAAGSGGAEASAAAIPAYLWASIAKRGGSGVSRDDPYLGAPKQPLAWAAEQGVNYAP